MQTAMIFTAAAGIVLTAFVGIVFIGPFGRRIQPLLRFLVSFAVGVFMVTTAHLIEELAEASVSLPLLALAVITGMGILWITTKATPEAHHHHGADEADCCSPVPRIHPIRILVGDALHNISDGFMLVPAFALSAQAGMVTAIGIAIHELVQQLSEFFLLRHAGYSTPRAIIRGLLAQSSLFIGILAALFFMHRAPIAPYITALALGGFLYLVLFDLLPHTKETIRHHGRAWLHVIAFAGGVIVMLTLEALLGHG